MTPGEFIKQRNKIRHSTRSDGWKRRAVQRLAMDAKAVAVMANFKMIGWMLPSGKIVCSKTRYRTEGDATLNLQLIIARNGGNMGRHPIRAYFCANCAGWHLTSQE